MSPKGSDLLRRDDLISDIDECSLAERACKRKNENCYNTPGSFVCVCPEGFEETEDACVQTAEAGEWRGRGPRCWLGATSCP